MENLKKAIRKIGVVKRLRVAKWKKLARARMFHNREVTFLINHPEEIPKALNRQLKKMPDGGTEVLKELNAVYDHSPLSKRLDLDETATKQDLLFWHFAYGFTFNEYVSYQFVDKDDAERRTFLSDRDSACLCYDLNDLEDRMVLANKAATYQKFKPYYGREAIVVASPKDYEAFQKFTERHVRFVKKNALESCGRSVEMIDLMNTSASPYELFETWIKEGETILEELIIQNEELQTFNKSSVNTLRAITFHTRDDVVVPFFFFKTGRKGSFVDNGAAGGLIIAVDRKTGVLGIAADEYGNRFEKHPDSGVQFVGFQLPDWNQVNNLCKEMSAMLPTVRVIGWDLAYTDKGWVVIEGNSMTEAIGPQSTRLKGMREEVERLRSKM